MQERFFSKTKENTEVKSMEVKTDGLWSYEKALKKNIWLLKESLKDDSQCAFYVML